MLLGAVIAAGGDPGRDSELLAYAGGAPCKALIDLSGRTVLDLVVGALLGSGRVGRVVVVGLPERVRPDLGPRVTHLSDAGGIVQNHEAGVAHLCAAGQAPERIVLASGDIPLITPRIVSDLIDQCLPYDVDYCYSIVSRDVMERAFPGSGRTFVPLVEGWFAGGDVGVARASILQVSRGKLREVIGARKTFWRQVRAIGLDTLFLLLIRRLTIARLEQRAVKALGITGKAVICPHAEVAMDVDKPHHLDVVRNALARRAQGE